MTDPAIHTRGLTRKFGDLTAADNIDLNIPRGQIYGFLGPNGSGKTTIIRMLCGLLTPTSGEVSVLGLSVPADAEALRQKIGYMTQKFSLYDNLSIEENMSFVAKVYGLSRAQTKDKISSLLDHYSLTPLRKRRAGAMSGGQRQRLALATATIHEPTMLFLDEPTSAVDPENRRDFWEKLFDLSDQGTTILVSTHYMDEAERCHQLAVLEEGKLRAQGTPGQLMDELAQRVVKIKGADLRQIKREIMDLPLVKSAAQQGLDLRVLLKPECTNPADYLTQHLSHHALAIAPASPSLEDVFVAATSGENQ